MKGYLGRLRLWQDAQQFKNLVHEMLASMGGDDGFATAYHELWHDAGQTRDGRRLRTRLLETTARMTAAADLAVEKARARKHYDFWTDEELAQERKCLFADITRRFEKKDD
jgi:hypothetical protein